MPVDRIQAIRAIRAAADLPALVSETVKLRKQGSGWTGGPCPAHGGGARTPCLSIQPDKGAWHCFSCGAGGDAYDWLAAVHGMDFEDALEELGRRTGIQVPRYEAKPKAPGEDVALAALQSAQDWFVDRLLNADQAMAYLASRQITLDMIKEEGIGYAPKGWDVTIGHLVGAGFKADLLELAGIASRVESGRHIDFLRDRITVPIRNTRGQIVAFGGRCLPSAPPDSPKYMNTRETPLFKKGETVFHLSSAKGFLRDRGAVIVEGYFDVISLCQAGVRNAVAPLGTALTEQHLTILKRWTNRITIATDGDGPGQDAAHKMLKLALPAGFDVRFLALPKGEDPDTWARAMGSDAKAAVDAAPDWATFALDKAKAGKDLRRMEDRLTAAREVAEWIAYLPGPRREEVTLAAAHELKVPPQSLAPQAKAAPAQQASKQAPKPMAQPDDAIAAMISMAARGGPFVAWCRSISQGWWEWREGAGVLETLLDAEGDTEAMGTEGQAIVRAACAREQAAGQVDPKRLQLRLEREYIQRESRTLVASIANLPGDIESLAPLQQRLVELRARMAKLTRGVNR